MASVDDRIVQMEFNNRGFENGVATTLGTLQRLKNALLFKEGSKGLANIENQASHMPMGNMGVTIEGISGKLLALGTIGVTALANITNRAISAGAALVKSLTVAPILDGYHEYETQLNSIQTILANTQSDGTNIRDVNAALNQLNIYSDKTIYNFSEMTRNIGTFTAAGVKLKPAVAAIKGIANVAALSGSSSDQASTAMYQLSQAIANGKVGLQDWNSVVNAGMGGKVFQKALYNTAQQMGTINKNGKKQSFEQWTKAGNSFRNSLQSGWLTGEVLTNTLNQFTGDLTDAQLKSMGYNKEQIKSIQAQAKAASDAATKVKTFTQLMDTLREAVGSGWATTFQTIFGGFDEAKTLWTGVSVSIGGVISNSAKARNKILSDWKALGGRTVLIEGIRKAFADLGDLMSPIKKAFRDIFPRSTGKDLYDLTVRFRDFMNRLALGEDTMTNLRRTFRGVFAVLDIGKQIVSGIFHVFTTLFGALSDGSGSFLNFTGGIGDFLVSLDEAIKKGGALTRFFYKLDSILAVPVALLRQLANSFFGLFDGFKGTDKVTTGLDRVNDRLRPLSNLISKAKDAFGNFFADMGRTFKPALQAIANAFNQLGVTIANSFSTGNFKPILDALNTGLLAGILVLIKKFLSKGINVDLGGGVLGSIKQSFDGLTGSMKAMQTQIKSKSLLLIATAIGILTASVVALSLIDSAKLTQALKAMAVGFGELLGAMSILTKVSGAAGFVKIPIMAASLNLLATAILTLSLAVRVMSGLSWDQLEKGLTGVGVLLGVLSVASIILSKNSAGMIQASVGIVAIAIAMNLLAGAMKLFATMSWKEIAKGLAAVSGALVGIAIGMQLMPKGMILQGAGLLEIAVALNAIYLAVYQFAKLDWKTMGRGLAGVGGAIAAIGIGMRLMPRGIVLQAAGLVIVAGALLLIGKAVKQMGGLDMKVIGKGLGTIGASLAILAGGLYLMQGALGGAAALAITAGALSLLVPVIKSLGNASYKTIAKGLGTIAATFVVLGLGALALTPVIPALLALSLAILAIGAGVGIAAAGIGLLALGLAALAGALAGGITVLLEALDGIIERIPAFAVSVAKGLINILKIIGQNGPTIITAFGAIIGSLAIAIVKNMPKIVSAIEALIVGLLKVIHDEAPNIIAGGLELLLDLLHGISDNIGQIVTVVAQIIVKFLNALASHAGQIVAAGLGVIVHILQGIASGIGRIISAAFGIVTTFISGIARGAGRIVRAGADMIIHIITGIGNAAGRIVTAGTNAVIKFIQGVGRNAVRLANAGAKMIIDLINGIADAIEKNAGKLRAAGEHLAGALLDGMTFGMAGKAKRFITESGKTVDGALAEMKRRLGVKSPSTEGRKMMAFVGDGMILGLQDSKKPLGRASDDLANHSLETMKSALSKISDLIMAPINKQPTITPVLDLSNIQKDAATINSLLATTPIVATTSFTQAAGISADQQKAAQAAAPAITDSSPVVNQIKFEQNNNSPKALSTLEIYRQTKNQLALAKSAIGLPSSS